MSTPATAGALGARGWLLALCSAALAIAAHQSAGGAPADLLLSLLLTTVLAWGGASLGRRGGPVTLVAVLATTQTAQHLLLSEIAGGAHEMAQPVDGWLMFAAHAAATLASVVLLSYADAALAVVGAAVTWLVGRLLAVSAPVATAPPAAVVVTARPGPLLEVLLRRVSPRRGPPAHS